MQHQTHRVRHNSRSRNLKVLSKTHVTPRMLRIALGGEDLADFTTPSADDHIKLYVPGRAGELESRDFTPRHFDAASRQLTLDFALHQSGPAIEWAQTVKIGAYVEISGPRGSLMIPEDFDWWLLVGDETALPSIGRRVEGLRTGVRVITVVTIADQSERQVFSTAADHQEFWVHRSSNEATNPEPLMTVLERLKLPPGDGFVWIAAEAKVVRAAKEYAIHNMRHPREWLRGSGYWIKGRADTYDKLENDGRHR
jgi:NADPH-dependent ferric siderophore reductase